MFTDMVGFSALSQRNEALALELLEEHRKLLREIVPRHDGREVKTMGDGFLFEFSSALAGVRAALEIQRCLHDRNQSLPGPRHVRLRIGIHVGDVVASGGDIHGDGVNLAARIEPLAAPGGVCVSQAVFEQVRNKVDVSFSSLGETGLKNIELPMQVQRIVMPWESAGSATRTRGKPASLHRAIAGGVVLAGLALAFWQPWRKSSPPPPAGAQSTAPNVSTTAPIDAKSVAVLAFANLSDDKANEYFSDGVSEELLNVLSKIPGLKVSSRTSAFSFKGRPVPISEIAKQLGVAYVIEGSVRKSGDRLRITAQLIDATSGFHVWSDNFDRDTKDVFAIQSEVANQVLAALKLKLQADGGIKAAQGGTENLEAYDLILRGRYHWNKRTAADLRRAIGYFEQAIEKDPKYAHAYAGLALSYVLLPSYAAVPTNEANSKARAAARRALELDDRLGEAHTALGSCAASDGDLVAAAVEYREALRLNPNYPTTHHWYGNLLSAEGNYEEALVETRKALALDPLSPVIQCTVGTMLYWLDRVDEAFVEVDKALELSPDFAPAYTMRGELFVKQGKFGEAIAEFEKVRKLTAGSPNGLGDLGHAFARAGRADDANQVLVQLKDFAAGGSAVASELAYVYEGLGNLDEALFWMERALQNREVTLRWVRANNPRWRDLATDPRGMALLDKFEPKK